MLYDPIYIKYQKIQIIGTESRPVVAQRQEEAKSGREMDYKEA